MIQKLIPNFETDEISCGQFTAVRRKWQVSIWDWAYLSTEHDLQHPYQLMDAAAQSVNLELRIDAESIPEAIEKLQAIRLSLYANGLQPVVVPTISTHSVNDFSAVQRMSKEPGDPRFSRAKALTSKTETVWAGGLRGGPVFTQPRAAIASLSQPLLDAAADDALRWQKLVDQTPQLKVLENAVLTAPEIANVGQSLLQLWTGLESIFPDVRSELAFRLSLYLAQLDGSDRVRRYEHAREAYKVRSKVAHGENLAEPSEQNLGAWDKCWDLACFTVKALLARGELPNAEQLTSELLAER